jgi:hypothetical protein
MVEIYKIIPAKEFRNTESVQFHSLPLLENLKGLDLVRHQANAISPGSVGDTEKPWYMHPHQIDNLIVFQGVRYVDLYRVDQGEVVRLEVTPEKIIKNGEVLYEGPAMLSWPTDTFHRITSGTEGSYSLNFAVREEGFDIKTNFNIFKLDSDSGQYEVVREGFKDQKPCTE